MSITISIIALVILVAALILVRRTQKSITHRPPQSGIAKPVARKSENTKFHAVSIRIGKRACQGAKDIQGERFLAAEAPEIPLADCDVASCECRFAHFKDRRARDDRRNPYRGTLGLGTGNLKQEQRAGRDRRHDDDEY